MHHPLLLIFVKITIFSLMLAIGSNLCFEEMLSLWRKPALLFRALLAVVVLVPLVVIVLLKLFNLPPEVMTGLALFIAILNNVEQKVIPTLIAYVILGAFLGSFYSIWNKRKLEQQPN